MEKNISGNNLIPMASNDPNALKKNVVILVVLIAVVTTFLNYRGFGRENQIAEFPIIYRAMDSNYLTNDFYTNRASEFGPRYFYAKFIALISTEKVLPLVAFSLIMLINISIALITLFFTRELFNGSLLAGVLAVVFVMTIKTFKLGYWSYIYSNQLLSSSLAVPFIFASFWAAIRCRPYLLAVFAGIAVLIHPSFAAECGILAFLVLFIQSYMRGGAFGHSAGVRRTQPVKASMTACRKNRRFNTLTKVLWGSRGRFFKRAPWPPEAGLIKSGGAIAIFFIFVAIPLIPYLSMEHIDTQQFMAIETFFRHPHHSVPSHFRSSDYAAALIFLLAAGLSWFWVKREDVTFPFVTLVILFLCFCGYLFVEVFPLRLLAIARPFRLLFIVKWLGLIMVAGAAAYFMRARLKWLLSPGYKLKSRVFYAVVTGLVGIMICLSIIYYTPIKILPEQAVSMLKGIMPELRYVDLRTLEVEAARFARSKTPVDAVFLTPPGFGKFRLVARRAMVVDWRSFPFQDRAMVEWQRRLFDCYGIPESVGLDAREELTKNYKKITDSRILNLQKKYGFSYVVLYKETSTKFPVVYENRKYKILSLQEF